MDLDFRLNGTTALSSAILAGPSSLAFVRATDGTAWDENGVLLTRTTGQHRFDHDPADELLSGDFRPLGYLSELAATNECLESETFDTTWSEVGTAVVTANNAVAPDGNTTADELDDNDASSKEGVTQSVTVSADTTSWSLSVFVKKTSSTSNKIQIRMNMSGGSAVDTSIICDPDTGAITADIGSPDASGVIDAKDYWRFWVAIANINNTAISLEIYSAFNTDGSSTPAVAATGTADVWGVQLENTAGPPSSYIGPTTSSVVTRDKDQLKTTDVSWYADGLDGTFYTRGDVQGPEDSQKFFMLSEDGFGFVEVNIFLDRRTETDIEGQYDAPVNARIFTETDVRDRVPLSVELAFAELDAKIFLNGAPGATDSTTVELSADAAINSFHIAQAASNDKQLQGHIAQIRYYSERRDDSDALIETSWINDPNLHLDFALDAGSAINDAVVVGPAALLTHTRPTDATGFDENGVLVTASAGDPVFGHDPADSDAPLGLQVEEARTNECDDSNDPTQWNFNTHLTTLNDAVSPDGTTNATKLEDDNASGFESSYFTVTVSDDSTPWCASFFVKKDDDETRFPGIHFRYLNGSAHNAEANFNTKTGAISVNFGTSFDGHGVIDSGDYWRFWFVKNNDSSGDTTIRIQIYGARTTVITTNQSSTVGSIHHYGMQLENAASPSSHIATTGTVATRDVVDCSASALGWLNRDGSGTYLVEGDLLSNVTALGQDSTILGLTAAGSDPKIELMLDDTSEADSTGRTSGQAANALISTAAAQIADNTMRKMAFAWLEDDAEMYVDGSSAGTDTSADLVPADEVHDTLQIGALEGSTNIMNGHAKTVKYWRQRFPAADLDTIATL